MEELLQTHHRAGYLWARQCCHFRDDWAEEVLQITFLKILEGQAIFQEKSDFKTWFFSVIRYTAYEWMRKEKKYQALEPLADWVAEEETAAAYHFHQGMLQSLPHRQREVMLLVFYHQLTLDKAAAVMDIHPGSAATHYHRAKEKLKSLILRTKYQEK